MLSMRISSAPDIPYLFAQIVHLDETSLQAVEEHSETTDKKGNVKSDQIPTKNVQFNSLLFVSLSTVSVGSTQVSMASLYHIDNLVSHLQYRIHKHADRPQDLGDCCVVIQRSDSSVIACIQFIFYFATKRVYQECLQRWLL